MTEALWVGVGGFLGANARYLVSTWLARFLDPTLPWGTLAVNTTGSLLIGAFLVWTTERVIASPDLRLLVAVGFCGSYTTFSSFAFETMRLLEQGHWLDAIGSFLLNNVLALAAVLAGMTLVRWVSS
ncbi:MAG: fluoride efflux transporter CrcB [Gammaproteobacteria bacterium]